MKRENHHRHHHQHNSSCHKKVIKIKAIPTTITTTEMMYEKVQTKEDDNVKIRAEREMEMTTNLLAEAGIEEPKLLGIRSGILLKSYLIACTVTKKYIIKESKVFISFYVGYECVYNDGS